MANNPTEAQKKLGKEYENGQKEAAQQKQQMEKLKSVLVAEVDLIIKFLHSNGLKKKKVIYAPTGRPDDKTFAQEYFTGKQFLLIF